MTQTQTQTQTRDLEAADYHKGELQGRSGRAEAASGPGAPLQLCESASAAPDPTPALAPLRAGYLELLAQLTKVGDYDEATFTGELLAERLPTGQQRNHLGKDRIWARQSNIDNPAPAASAASAAAERLKEMSKDDTYKVVVIEGELEHRGRHQRPPHPTALARGHAPERSTPLRLLADLDTGKVIATATLFVERKFIRNCGKCGHIEDVVVDSTYRGLRLGARLAHAAFLFLVPLFCSPHSPGRPPPRSCRLGPAAVFRASSPTDWHVPPPAAAQGDRGAARRCQGVWVLQGHPGLQRGQRRVLRKVRPD